MRLSREFSCQPVIRIGQYGDLHCWSEPHRPSESLVPIGQLMPPVPDLISPTSFADRNGANRRSKRSLYCAGNFRTVGYQFMRKVLFVVFDRN